MFYLGDDAGRRSRNEVPLRICLILNVSTTLRDPC